MAGYGDSWEGGASYTDYDHSTSWTGGGGGGGVEYSRRSEVESYPADNYRSTSAYYRDNYSGTGDYARSASQEYSGDRRFAAAAGGGGGGGGGGGYSEAARAYSGGGRTAAEYGGGARNAPRGNRNVQRGRERVSGGGRGRGGGGRRPIVNPWESGMAPGGASGMSSPGAGISHQKRLMGTIQQSLGHLGPDQSHLALNILNAVLSTSNDEQQQGGYGPPSKMRRTESSRRGRGYGVDRHFVPRIGSPPRRRAGAGAGAVIQQRAFDERRNFRTARRRGAGGALKDKRNAKRDGKDTEKKSTKDQKKEAEGKSSGDKAEKKDDDKPKTAEDLEAEKKEQERLEAKKKEDEEFADNKIPKKYLNCHICVKKFNTLEELQTHTQWAFHKDALALQEIKNHAIADLHRAESRLSHHRFMKRKRTAHVDHCFKCNFPVRGSLNDHLKTFEHMLVRSFTTPRCCYQHFKKRRLYEEHLISRSHIIRTWKKDVADEKAAAESKETPKEDAADAVMQESETAEGDAAKVTETIEVDAEEATEAAAEGEKPEEQEVTAGEEEKKDEVVVAAEEDDDAKVKIETDVKLEANKIEATEIAVKLEQKPIMAGDIEEPNHKNLTHLREMELSKISFMNIRPFDRNDPQGMSMFYLTYLYYCGVCKINVGRRIDAVNHCATMEHYEALLASLKKIHERDQLRKEKEKKKRDEAAAKAKKLKEEEKAKKDVVANGTDEDLEMENMETVDEAGEDLADKKEEDEVIEHDGEEQEEEEEEEEELEILEDKEDDVEILEDKEDEEVVEEDKQEEAAEVVAEESLNEESLLEEVGEAIEDEEEVEPVAVEKKSPPKAAQTPRGRARGRGRGAVRGRGTPVARGRK